MGCTSDRRVDVDVVGAFLDLSWLLPVFFSPLNPIFSTSAAMSMDLIGGRVLKKKREAVGVLWDTEGGIPQKIAAFPLQVDIQQVGEDGQERRMIGTPQPGLLTEILDEYIQAMFQLHTAEETIRALDQAVVYRPFEIDTETLGAAVGILLLPSTYRGVLQIERENATMGTASAQDENDPPPDGMMMHVHLRDMQTEQWRRDPVPSKWMNLDVHFVSIPSGEEIPKRNRVTTLPVTANQNIQAAYTRKDRRFNAKQTTRSLQTWREKSRRSYPVSVRQYPAQQKVRKYQPPPRALRRRQMWKLQLYNPGPVRRRRTPKKRKCRLKTNPREKKP